MEEPKSNKEDENMDNTEGGSLDIAKNNLGKIYNYNTFKNPPEKLADELSELSLKGSVKSTQSVTKPNSKFLHAFLNLTKAYLGMGPLTITSAMKHAGVGLGFIGIFSCGILALYGINIMVLARRKILKERYPEEGQANYLPEEPIEAHRELRPDEIEEIDEDDIDKYPFRASEISRGYTDIVVQSKHKLKTYSDLGRELFGDSGYYLISAVIFIQQLIIVTAYFYFLNQYFPAYIVLIGITPICMF